METSTPAVHLDDHVADQIAAVEETLARVDEVFGNLSSIDYHDITKNMSSIDKAKYDLTNLYAINSLFWMYLRSFGEDPKNTSIKEELNRIKIQMVRLSQIANKSKMPRIDKDAANRFIRHGIGKRGNIPQKQIDDEENWDDEPMETDSSKSRKRKREDGEDDEDDKLEKEELSSKAELKVNQKDDDEDCDTSESEESESDTDDNDDKP